MTMQAGKLDRKITIQRKSSTLSESGDPVDTWANVAIRRSASMWPFRGTEGFSAPEETSFEQVEFRVRYSSDIADLSPKDRIICPALTEAQAADGGYVIPGRSIYDVVGVLEINRREGLKIITQRRPDLTT
jgi:head-tail adaptor